MTAPDRRETLERETLLMLLACAEGAVSRDMHGRVDDEVTAETRACYTFAAHCVKENATLREELDAALQKVAEAEAWDVVRGRKIDELAERAAIVEAMLVEIDRREIRVINDNTQVYVLRHSSGEMFGGKSVLDAYVASRPARATHKETGDA